MKHHLTAAILFIALVSCQDSESFSPAELAASLELKRGNAISCGSPSMQYGSLQFEIDADPEVQDLFNLGVKMLHSFEYDEAEKIFASVIDKDDRCAMAYWGVAMSNFHPLWTPPTQTEFNKGTKALQIAERLCEGDERASAYIQALKSYFTEGANETHRSRCLRFEEAMQSLYEKYPDDKEAAIFYALALTAAADPLDKSYRKQKKSVGILNGLYPGQPDHPGIIHYTIHAYDAPELARLALPAARKYASVAPSSAHALHMPSHIFTRLGYWDEAIRSNSASVEAAKCYAVQSGMKGHWDEELHGLDYLVYAFLQKGDNKSAMQQWNYMKTIREVEPLNFKVVYAYAAIPARYLVENKKWREAATVDIHIKNFNWSGYEWQKAMLHFTRVLGRVHTRDERGAIVELRQLQNIYDTLLARKDEYKANQVLVQLTAAKAWLHFLQKKPDALTLMFEAAELEDKTEKHPVTPGEIIPARQLLGDMLVLLAKYDEALTAFESENRRHPNRFNTLYGAAMSAEKLRNREKARLYFRQLNSMAAGSQRQEMIEAERFMRQDQEVRQ